jgi:hypothetical protein
MAKDSEEMEVDSPSYLTNLQGFPSYRYVVIMCRVKYTTFDFYTFEIMILYFSVQLVVIITRVTESCEKTTTVN